MEIDFGDFIVSKANIIKNSTIKNNCGDVTVSEINEEEGILNIDVKIGKLIKNR